ncbi:MULTISPECIES: methylated-DNA--[protein]-cysteine S-methyltransferase [Bacillus]|uniref:methylated-DNA--[protein]-cysteine S-methyltransferase n=1 Tax=Bacillus TaxID=1386 RepID=UPI0002F1D622|nr:MULTISPECIES: methylated-DNA--[protein]-cysteine S-methyltransferase [Bacillus]
MKNIFFYQTDIGKIGIEENGTAITRVYFQDEEIPQDVTIVETELLKEAGRQLHNYFSGKQTNFTLPLSPNGTEFMKNVWNSLYTIPYGETRSYKQIAESINNPKAMRAVGMANNRNPIPIFIPCHRVIGANGKLVGYGGGLHIKEYLLKIESK